MVDIAKRRKGGSLRPPEVNRPEIQDCEGVEITITIRPGPRSAAQDAALTRLWSRILARPADAE